MTLERPSTLWDGPWKSDTTRASEPKAFFYAGVKKRQSIEILDWGSAVKRWHNSLDFLLEPSICHRVLQKMMQGDRQRRSRCVCPCHKHQDGFGDEMLFCQLGGCLLRGRDHVLEHGPGTHRMHLVERLFGGPSQLKEAIGNSTYIVVSCPSQSFSKDRKMLELIID